MLTKQKNEILFKWFELPPNVIYVHYKSPTHRSGTLVENIVDVVSEPQLSTAATPLGTGVFGGMDSLLGLRAMRVVVGRLLWRVITPGRKNCRLEPFY